MNNRDRLVNELIWSCIFIAFLFFTIKYSITSSQIFNKDNTPLPSLAAMFVIPILFGMLLGLPALIERWDKGGHFYWLKLLIQGLPALWLLGISVAIMNVGFRHSFDFFPKVLLDMYAPTAFIVYLSGVLFGKVFVDCFRSEK